MYKIKYHKLGEMLDMTGVNEFNSHINKSIGNLFQDALRLSMRNPSQAWFLLNTIRRQKNAAKRRLKNEEHGLHIPPFMITSITNRCNLKCKGCYAQAHHRNQGAEMSTGRLKSVIGEARDLGVSIILLAGGEPLVRRKEIFEITGMFPDIIFPLFTNGMLIDDDVIDILTRQRNVVPVVSIEGHQEDTDRRRGDGVYGNLKKVFAKMNEKGIFYGTSITLTRTNYDTVIDKSFIRELASDGCKLFFFVEYIPVKPGTEDWVLTETQRNSVPLLTSSLRNRFPGIFIAFPGDEKALGGCLAAGRGFIHVSPEGNLEPCPFAPFSDTNLNEISLKDALKSNLLNTIRQNHNMLVEGQGGCTLWENRDWVQSLIR